MIRRHVVLLSILAAMPVVLEALPSGACSCMEPEPRLLSPARGASAPKNARVRVVVPAYSAGKLSFRKHGGGEVAGKRVESKLANSTEVELTPDQPLEPDTRYEVAMVDPARHPSTLVFGGFRTGTDTDAVAPTSAKLGRATVNGKRWSTGTSCAVDTPWVEIPVSGSKDPSRDGATLLYAIWTANKQGVIDTAAPPTSWVEAREGKLKLGRTSYCDPDDFPLPRSGSVTLAIASVDEAGNRSPIQRLSIPLSQAAKKK